MIRKQNTLPDTAIIFKRNIIDQNIEQIFNQTLSWVKKEKCQIQQQRAPSFLEIKHRGDWRDRGFILKIIQFTFTEETFGVIVEIKINKLSIGESAYSRSIYFQWKKIVEEYFEYIGYNIDMSFITDLYSLKEIQTEIKRIIAGLFVSLLFTLSQVWATIVFPNLFTPIVVFFILYYFSLPDYRRYQSYKKRERMFASK